MKDFLAETCFQRGWESVDRHFRRLKQAANRVQDIDSGRGISSADISGALDSLTSQVEIFADHWQHFHLRIEALLREYGLIDLLEEYEKKKRQESG